MVLLFVAGCTSFSESQGDQMLAPVVAEIAAYRQATGRLPDRLDELPGFARLQLEGKSDAGLVWSITRLRPSANSYWLEFNHAHGIVRYVDGKKVFAKGNPWR